MNFQKIKGDIFVIIAGLMWGTMGVFSRYFNSIGLGSLEIAQLRITVGLLFVGSYLLIFHREKLKIKLRDVWCFIGTGIVSLLLFCVCYFKAIEELTLSAAGVLLYTAPIFVMIMSIPLFKEKLTAKKVIALALAFSGCVLISGIGGEINTLGVVMGVLSGFFYALYSIFGRYAINRGYDSWTIVFYTFLFCTLGCLLLSDKVLIIDSIASADAPLWFYLIGMGLITGFLAYLFYSKGLECMESSRASILAFVEPVSATFVGMIVFSEFPNIFGISGILLVLGAIVLLSTKNARKK